MGQSCAAQYMKCKLILRVSKVVMSFSSAGSGREVAPLLPGNRRALPADAAQEGENSGTET